MARSFSKPWAAWCAGVLLLSLAAGLTLRGGERGLAWSPTPAGFVIWTLGLGTLAWGAIERFRSDARCPRLLAAAVALFHFAVAGFFTWMLIAALRGVDPFSGAAPAFGRSQPLRPGFAGLLWLVAFPTAIAGLRRAVNVFAGDRDAESGVGKTAYLMAAFFALGIAVMALPIDARGDSLRHFLGVLGLALAALCPLASIDWPARRRVLSAIVCLHFGGIFVATLGAPPTPWSIGQAWVRLAQPYLEFMYLNNAYHFYAPDPGPASYLWFRLYYETGEKRDGFPVLDGVWLKLPDVDANGNHRHPIALDYQRFLALTENAANVEVSPPLMVRAPNGRIVPNDFYLARLVNSPDRGHYAQTIVGKEAPEFVLSIPFANAIGHENQFVRTNLVSRRLIESYVRRAAQTPHPTHPERKVHQVRVYRVIHNIPNVRWFREGHSPNDPESYRPIYQGTFLPNGMIVDPNDPLLYWHLPIQRAPDAPVRSRVYNYAALHAGDPDWIYDPGTGEWGKGEAP